jgi:hypothetical protein
MSAIVAVKSPHFSHDEIPSLDSQRFPFHERFRHFPAGRFHNPSERGARNLHAHRRLILVHPLLVGQAQRFHFVHGQDDLLEFLERDAARLEVTRFGVLRNPPAEGRSGHRRSPPGIMSICS